MRHFSIPDILALALAMLGWLVSCIKGDSALQCWAGDRLSIFSMLRRVDKTVV